MAVPGWRDAVVDLDSPTVLYESAGHGVYWLGIMEETAFRCNAYLVRDGANVFLFDPGNRGFFDRVRERVEQIMDPGEITGMVLCHQDPDVAASMVDWLAFNPALTVFSTTRSQVLLRHYGAAQYEAVDVDEIGRFAFDADNGLRFIEAPFLHSPGAFVTYDEISGCLFSGDIWAALDTDWRLTVEEFADHVSNMDLFHVDYMASNLAARGFLRRLQGLDVQAILPQHGSIIGPKHVEDAMTYLRELRCGTDIIYADLE